MKKKEQELLNYLSEFNKPVRSAEIANALDISVRSVKNYVHNINSLYGKNIILSSRIWIKSTKQLFFSSNQ